ncbi:hypothetical protein I302_103697 [Kwoniella bestiolae CBS 10118]|uniref:N-acetyltransferase domain-containing protein n=1 Tax=Kwoniella bestiolae CBS 10118 TaxID=1296100 RepID=A0A1B9G9A6_9TREE|nr:hypothetical protein I302_02402 [Kwoniella bestiolae CBS 10118]OCF27560.1 hypothetical protein I302_02402 [Kwoniella bestiolae CBS 10118]
MSIQPTTLEPSHADSTPSHTPIPTTSSSTSSTPQYQTREGTPADAQQISELVGTTWSKLFGYSVSPTDLEQYITITLSPSSFEAELQSPQNIFICAYSPSDESKIVGVAQLVLDSKPSVDIPNSIELQRLYAHPSTHGTGLGQLLISESEEKARQLGKNKIWLGVWENNTRGIRFYGKVGFREVGEKVFFAGGSRRRDLVMCKDV